MEINNGISPAPQDFYSTDLDNDNSPDVNNRPRGDDASKSSTINLQELTALLEALQKVARAQPAPTPKVPGTYYPPGLSTSSTQKPDVVGQRVP